MAIKTIPKISSFAAPTDTDLAIMQTMSDADKRALIGAELDRRRKLAASSMTRDEVLDGLRPHKNG